MESGRGKSSFQFSVAVAVFGALCHSDEGRISRVHVNEIIHSANSVKTDRMLYYLRCVILTKEESLNKPKEILHFANSVQNDRTFYYLRCVILTEKSQIVPHEINLIFDSCIKL
ncbi:hypothetical protein HYN59_05130 [Flavobacterium album]|uniref:Uncharacterized protein n=1 Tax=Flavobacterium album TaxID=2175091 RepID=A0A2S1QVU3_9FLAO|nr:hypothetical protein HYN59_05130 [Flavobacterium album]